jgi:hypothetical protein
VDERTNSIHVLMIGTNDPGSVTLAEGIANIDNMVSAFGTSKFVVLTPLRGVGQEIGTAAGTQLEALRQHILTAYPTNSIDTYGIVIANGNGSTQDNLDVANGISPSSLRMDTIHLTQAGLALAVSGPGKTFIDGKGW